MSTIHQDESTITFKYNDNNKLIRIEDAYAFVEEGVSGGLHITDITYSRGGFITKEYETDEESITTTNIYNNDGFVGESKEVDLYLENTRTEETIFTYQNWYMKSSDYSVKNKSEFSDDYSGGTVFTWNGGNITELVETERFGTTTCTCIYTEHEDKANLDFTHLNYGVTALIRKLEN